MRKDILDYICSLHGYLIRLKEFHWSTDSDAEHHLCDEISDCVSGCEDEFAEVAMGLYNEKIKVGELKPLLPNSNSLRPMLKELVGETLTMKKKLNREVEAGLCTILDDVIKGAQKYMYRGTQK